MIHVETIDVDNNVEELAEVLDNSDEYIGIYFSTDNVGFIGTSLTYASKTLINNYYDSHKQYINADFVRELESNANWYEAYEPLILPFVRLFVPTGKAITYSLELARYIEVLFMSDDSKSGCCYEATSSI
jgi:predicted choloylglycine hydrolase